MLTFNLKGLNKGKIWLDSNINLKFDNITSTLIFNLTTNKNIRKIENNRTIIIELFMPRGGRILYGALGATYQYKPNNNNLLVKVNVSNSCGKIFDESLINNIELAHVGIPEEFSNAIYSGLHQAYDEAENSLSGKINFCYAAYSEISSCAWIFQKLSHMIYNLMQIPNNEINNEILIKLYEQATRIDKIKGLLS